MIDDVSGELVGLSAFEGVYGLDERSLRRPGWYSCRDVLLSNGQYWDLPGIGAVEAMLIPDLYGRTLALPERAADDPDDVAFWVDKFRADAALRDIGADLLLLNYAIDRPKALALTTCLLEQDAFNLAVLRILIEGGWWWRMMSPQRHDSVLFPN